MEERQENLQYFKERHPDIYKAYEAFGKELHDKGGPIAEQSRWLIKVAVSAASQYEYALQTHIEKALKAGCLAEEIEHAILLIAPTAGFPRMMTALMTFRSLFKE